LSMGVCGKIGGGREHGKGILPRQRVSSREKKTLRRVKRNLWGNGDGAEP